MPTIRVKMKFRKGDVVFGIYGKSVVCGPYEILDNPRTLSLQADGTYLAIYEFADGENSLEFIEKNLFGARWKAEAVLAERTLAEESK